jgi:23S rRNA (cytidine1920-2'-O)/16S rRNA (cytidine1409-2'-O)-methyltransferase
MRARLDTELVKRGLVASRSQAESYIKLGHVKVNGRSVTKPGFLVAEAAGIELTAQEQYVSRAALKLASVAESLQLDFKGATVLDVGSSTGGFTDFALRHGARRVIAVEIGTDQLHPSMREDPRIELHEKTDIRDVQLGKKSGAGVRPPVYIETAPDIVVADVSFVSLREILPSIAQLSSPQTRIIVMVKPQFEARQSTVKHKGVIKNDAMRRTILKDFEWWVAQHFRIIDKADSKVSGAKGNRERFYRLQKITPPPAP